MFCAMGDSENKLGYRPQKELIYNQLLPYSENLYKESQLYLAEIKANLGNAILLRELIPEAIHWTDQLAKYIRLYGRLFSKEDHLTLIRLLYEIVIIPDLELSAVQKVAYTLNILLKKTNLLSRDDLELQWRPLYELYERILYSPYEHLGMFLLPGNLESTLKVLIRSSRQYFSVDATKEMLDEWRPLVCPFDVTMVKAMSYFELFLCTTLQPQYHDKGFKLWFQEFMDIWNVCQNGSSWENSIVWLFSRLARDNIGYVDWEPHIPLLFTRLLRSFNLPGGPTKVTLSRSNSNFDTIATVNWIASMLGGGSCCQVHISRLFKSLESYYHPSNNGRWIIKLQRLIHKLPVAVVKRLHKERYKKLVWETPVPEEKKLTDAEITEFVESLKSVALLAMFSKTGSMDSAVALQNLSILRPEIVIPPVLERLYSSLETLTEPHRLTATMHCVVSVARGIVQGNKFFPEGPSHVIPLLMGALPGLDPNDIKKCMVTFQFISTFTTLILLADCSDAVNDNPDMSEQKRELCLATAAFEDFVLQFMDKCFNLITNSSLEHPSRLDRDTERMNVEENILEVCLSSTFSNLLTQSSPAIYKSALQKLYSFVSSHILEIKVSGKYAANMCRSAARVNAELALQTFIPHFCRLAMALTSSDDVIKEEKLDAELLFCLLLLSEVVRCDGSQLLKYFSHIEQVLQRTLHLKCREGYHLAGALLKHTLRAFTLVYPLDFRSISTPWEDYDAGDHTNYIKDWGKCGDVHNLGMKFHVPADEEIAVSQKLLETFLLPELDKLNLWVNKEENLTREDIQCTLSIVLDCLLGASGALPLWPGDYLSLKASDSKIPLYCPHIKETGSKVIHVQDGKNVRLLILDVMRKVLDRFLESCEDDTKSLFLIIQIYNNLMFHWGLAKEDFETRWKGFHVVKKVLENKLIGRKQHIRALLVDRIFLQHEMRLLDQNKGYFTEHHASLMRDLLKLSISHYSEVRSRAQHVLYMCIRSFHHSYNVIIPELLELLQIDPTVYHEEFKGALYIILGHKQASLLTVRNWDLIRQLWPALVAAKYSEKPSIIKLLDQTSSTIQKYLETAHLKSTVPSKLLEMSKGLWCCNHVPPSSPQLSDAMLLKAETNLQQRNADNERNYYLLVDSIVNLINDGNLHWRHYHLALTMLCMSIRHDVALPERAVDLFVKHLVHETLNVRKISVTAMCAILKQQKRRHSLREINPCEIELNQVTFHPSIEANLQGHRPENLWLQYNSLAAPSTQEMWNKHYFVHKTHVGFYSWSKPFKVYCQPEEQPPLDRTREQLAPEEVPVYNSFSQEQFVDRLISFLSLEERKGHDKFDAKRFFMFKGLFRNFGDKFLPLFVDHLKRLVADKQESLQRCAAEIITGLLKGSKHWNFEKVQSLREQLTPVLKSALNNVTPETLSDWGTCIATISESRDPNKYFWLFELLMEIPIKEESGSFLESSWLYMLLGALSQQEWRVAELLHRLFAYLEPRLSHSYENVREKLGSLLSNIFMYDLPLDMPCLKLSPRREAFLKSVLPQLSILDSSDECIDNELPAASGDGPRNNFNHVIESAERKNAINLFRTICRFVVSSVTRTLYAAPPEIFQLLPKLCIMQSDTTDDELQNECKVTIAVLGHAILRPCSITSAISTLKQIISSNSWHARSQALSFLQVMVFSNLFSIMHNDAWCKDIGELVLRLLEDERVEVREAAAETLGGLLHCEFVKIDKELIRTFLRKCDRKLKRIQSAQGGSAIRSPDPNELKERHAGVLGLCACVNAYPYDVPDFLPQVLVHLANHLHDPQPIQTTIKRTLSNFRRTHYDNWRDHKLKFTEDQLTVITDLLVSPSYYA